jgi:ubiquinone/menaquinone biosynthesis C-methylase UbiE
MARVNLGHCIIGFEGLAILRTWLRPGAEATTVRVRELAELLARPDQPPLSVEFDAPRKDPRAGYREWSSTYDAGGNPLIALEEPVVQDLLSAFPPGKALDAACGTGRHTRFLAARGHQVIGVDPSPEMLTVARAKVPAAEFRAGDFSRLPLDDRSVDVAVCSLALTHVRDLRPAMAELARVVRPGGGLVLSDAHPFLTLLSGEAFYQAADGSFGYVTNHFHSHGSYFEAFAAAGLTVQKCLDLLYTEAEAEMIGVGFPGVPREALQQAVVGLPGALVWQLVVPH